jgi:hypothetical protein
MFKNTLHLDLKRMYCVATPIISEKRLKNNYWNH